MRIGFIGAGGNTKLRHLPGFAAIEGVELAAVANRTTASAERAAHEFGIPAVRNHWREIVEDPTIDAVCIGTWPNTHAEMTCAALAAGKHVLVEARMADTLANAEQMLSTAQDHPDLVAQIVPSPFTLEADAIMREILQQGRLGRLQEIRSHWSNDSTTDAAAPLHWRMDEQISGINIMALGICYEPLLRWLEGDPVVESAYGEIITRQRTSDDGSLHVVKVPERLDVVATWGDARLRMHQSSVTPGGAVCTYRLVGDRGGLSYDVLNRQLEISMQDGSTESLELPTRENGGWVVESDFVNSIREKAPVKLTDFSTGLRYMQFTHAVWAAAKRQE